MKLLCSILQLLLYLAVTGRSSDAQLLQQDDDVFLHHSRTDELGLQLAAGTNSIDAIWDVVPGASYYNISWTPGDNGGTDTVNAGNNTEYNISGLVSCTVYTVTVQPRNSEGDVGVSETKSKTTVASDPCLVTNIKVDTVPDQSSQLAVSWAKAEGAGNCAITYSITWSPASGGGGGTTRNLSYTITGLAAFTTYSVCVAATTDGEHYTKNPCSSGTTDEDKPGPVSIIDLTSLNDSSLYVRWEAPDKPNGVITQYRITWTWEDDTSHYQVNNTTTSYTSYTITDLHPCTIYTVTVSAATSKGFGVESAPQSTTTDSIAPDPPEVTAVMVVDKSQQLSVSWTQPDAPGPQCPITKYNVTWYLASTHQLVNQTTTSDTNLTICNLEAWTNYTVCVAAAAQQNSVDKYSEQSCTLVTVEQDTPGPPWGTMIEFHDSRSLLVSWSPPEEPRGIITNYNIMWNPPDIYNDSEATLAARVTQYIITNLQQCTTYTVTVTAATSKGYGEHSSVTGTTESEPPPSPSVTCEEVVSPHQASVTWPPVITTCTVSGYTVNYTGDVLWSDDTPHDSLQLPTTYADLSDLTPWTTYTVCVAGVVVNDIVGAWSCCNSTTLEAAPGMPVNLSVVSVSSKTLTVSWALPEMLNGLLTGYYLDWGRDDTSLTANTTLYTITDLHPNSAYDVTLMASTAAGWGPRAVVQGTTDEGVNVGAVVGGVVGGLLLLALLVAAVFFRHKIKDTFKAVKLKHQTRDLSVAPPPTTAHHIKKDELHQDIHHPGSSTRRVLETGQSHQKAHSSQHFFKATAKKDISYPLYANSEERGAAVNTGPIYQNEAYNHDEPIYMTVE